MLDELEADPSKGLLGYTRHGEPGRVSSSSTGGRSTRSRPTPATPAPGTRRCGVRGTGSARKTAVHGIWHETFKVSAGNYEAIYQNMPVMGLQKAGRPITVTEAKDSARARIST